TGNKSEYSVGYTTLYGDMAGGFAVIKDVPKTLVYEVARYVNAHAGREVIPESVFERAPSAELRPDQTDQDTRPPYAAPDPSAPAEPALEPRRSNSRRSRRSSGGRQSLRDENSRATLPACLPRCPRDGTSRPADRAGTGIRTTVLICIVWRRDSRGYPVARGSPSLDNSGASPHASCRESAPPSRRRSD